MVSFFLVLTLNAICIPLFPHACKATNKKVNAMLLTTFQHPLLKIVKIVF